MSKGIKRPVGANILAIPIYETTTNKVLKKFSDSQVQDVLKSTASGILMASNEDDFYEEVEEQVETNVVKVLDIGREVTLEIEHNKHYLVNKKGTPLSYNGTAYLIIRQEDFLIEVER